MSTPEKLYEGKAKILYKTEDPDILLTVFKDDATAFNAQKRGSISGKGEMNCAISSYLFQELAASGIPNHFIDRPTATEMRVQALKIVPLEVVVRNIAAGSLCQQTGLTLGTILPYPLVEFYYKNDALGDPLLTRDRLLLLELATPDQIEQLQHLALRVNEMLSAFFQRCAINLVDFKLEFGLDRQQNLILADEISPDTCRLWDQTVNDPNRRILDKDRFRQDLGEVAAAYQLVLERVLTQVTTQGV
ncbi:phosphoribosylaminoimidazole-succinocarboxamide synthase [Neosynechococcus sphagnicola sy1]|uniref:Phosphoribosylaminoimidazole-succinocarboxamide synthase n=1 Tax=Neosynechococcus sphagnicola sy1 TaxID=1497020 RepID=A0A098TJL4_9CYAN|nr:phosphoribosylaminoimidazolesuccinocarboxamide synthase [Neosynechococcus sphagnicola]KGF72459.1 phosphoribosylaminoimidazole-succinocarboxamide synthase [Neosynechococcus sphagnicola sy1]